MTNGPTQASKSASRCGAIGSACSPARAGTVPAGLSRNGSSMRLACPESSMFSAEASVPPLTPPRIEWHAFTLVHRAGDEPRAQVRWHGVETAGRDDARAVLGGVAMMAIDQVAHRRRLAG